MYAVPDEIIIRIFNELHVYDILNCSLTCRLFYETIRDSVTLQYRMELDISGVEDGDPECKLSVVERLTQLKTVERGWDNLHFRQTHRARWPPSFVWELFGGVLAYGVMQPIARGLSFIRLPSVVRGISLHTWEHRDMGVDIRDFAMDPAQDLAVLISHPDTVCTSGGRLRKFPIHLRTMSGGGCHPSALDSILYCTVIYEGPGYDFVIQIMDDFLTVLFHVPFNSWMDELFVWDWKKARLLTHLTVPSSTKIHSVSFLSPRHFIIARAHVERTQYSEGPPALEVYDFLASHPEGSTEPLLIRRFELPHLSQDVDTLSIITRSDPSPTSYSSSLPSHGRPFCTAPTSRLLTVNMQFLGLEGIFYNYMLFVHQSSLLENLEPDSMLDDVIIPWENWGYKNTRMISQFSESTWVCYVNGTRYVEQDSSGNRIRMLDFNPLALRRACKNPSTPEDADADSSRSTVVLESQPTIIDRPLSAFSQRVVTTLPYREVKSKEMFRYSAIMIDEDCILGMRRHTFSEREEIEILCI